MKKCILVILAMRKYLLLLLVILAGCSTSVERDGQNLKVIDVPLRSSNHEIRMSSFVDSISYIPLETKDECLIGFVDKIVATNDYYYVGIINHKESDTYMEAAGYKQNAVVNDMDDMAVFIPLTTYKNAVYSCISPGRFVESKAFGKQVELDDNPIIVKFELK